MFFCRKLNFVLFHVKFLPATNDCKTKVALIRQPIVCASQKWFQDRKKILPGKFSPHPKLTANKEGMPAKKGNTNMDVILNKLTEKWVPAKKRLLAKSNYQTYAGAKKKLLPAKKRLQSNLAASQKQLPTNCQWKPKVAASKKMAFS